MGYKPRIIDTELNNVKYEQYCNSISSRLNQLTNPDEVDCKRWPWELLQNAKDTVAKQPGRQVDVIYRFCKNEEGRTVLCFEHNGEQFSAKAIVGLIWKFSAEKRDEEVTEDGLKRDKQSTGRFGTGFLTTHALSRTISISGSMHDEYLGKNISVDFTLHREGPTDQDYRDGVDLTEKEAQYDVRTLPDGKPDKTRFTYFLTSDQNMKAAEMGIQNIIQNAAQTMLFCPTVRSITVHDDVNGKEFYICRQEENSDSNVKIVTFVERNNGDESVRKFVSREICEYSSDLSLYWHADNRNMRLQVAVETTPDNEILAIPFASSPAVYCSLPLIGFEKMTLPYYVNSNDFEPATERTSLFLNKLRKGTTYSDKLNRDVEVVYNNGVNWSILERSMALYEEVADYLVANGYTCRYNLMSGLETVLQPNAWKQEELDCIATRLVLPLRHMLMGKLLVKTAENYRAINSGLLFPYCADKHDRKAFYEIAEGIHKDNLPTYKDNLQWIEISWRKYTSSELELDKEAPDVQNKPLPLLKIEDVAEYVAKAKNLNGLILSAMPDTNDVNDTAECASDVVSPEDKAQSALHQKIQWLNGLYQWINNAKLQTLAENAIVPNRCGDFCSCSVGTTLKDAGEIESGIFAFMKEMGLNWDKDLLMEGIEHVTLVKETKDHIVSAIKEKVSEIIKTPNVADSVILTNLLPLLLAKPAETNNAQVKTFCQKRDTIIAALAVIENMTDYEVGQLNLAAECWTSADKWLMAMLAKKIAGREKLDTWTAETTDEQKKVQYCTAEWLQEVLKFMVSESYLHQEDLSRSDSGTTYAIIPNAHGDFCFLNELHSQGAVPDELLDATLVKTGFDVNAGLIFKGFELSEKLNISEYRLTDITAHYTTFFDSKESQEDKLEVASYLIHLLPLSEDPLSVLRGLWDEYQKTEDNPTKRISTTDSSVWTGVKAFEMKYLAEQLSAQNNLENLGRHLYELKDDEKEENIDFASVGLTWLNRLIPYLEANSFKDGVSLKLVPDYHGVLHVASEVIYNGSLLKQYDSVDSLIALINGDLWPFFVGKEEEDKYFSSKISHPDYEFASSLQDSTVEKLFSLVDRMVYYCYEKLNPDSKPHVKAAIEVLQSFFEDVLNSAASDWGKVNEEFLRKHFINTYPAMGDMLVKVVYDRDTRERLNRINERFSPQEQNELVNNRDEIKDYLANKEYYQSLEIEVERLKQLLSLNNIDDEKYANDETGIQGEQIVYEDLCMKYPSSEGYEVDWASRNCNERCFDFAILKDGQPFCYYDAKTTIRGIANADSIPFFMRMSQWQFLQTLDPSIPYFVARVFMGDGNQIKYMRIAKREE